MERIFHLIKNNDYTFSSFWRSTNFSVNGFTFPEVLKRREHVKMPGFESKIKPSRLLITP
jgi:hypothetical protein